MGPISPEGVCGASPLAAPSGLSLRSAPRRAQRAASEERARNERGTSEELVGRSAVRPSVGSGRSVGRRSAVGRSGRAARPCAPIRTARGGRAVRARPHRRGGSVLGARVRTAAAGAGSGRAFATPRGRGGRSAPNPCARRSAAVRAARSGALLRRWRWRGPCGASLTARHRPRLVSARPRRAPAAGAPCSGLGATHSPAAASGDYGTAPTPPPPRRSGRTAPRTATPRRSGRTAYGPAPEGAADGPRRAAPRDTTDRPPRADRGPTDRTARADRGPTDRTAQADRGPTDRTARAERATTERVARSLPARCSLVPRSLRAARAAARSAARAPQGRRGAKPRTLPRG